MSQFDQSPQARFQVVAQPGALPGACVFCGGTPSSEREFFVDPNFALEWHGAVYICKLCLFEMANVVGWIDPDQAVQLISRIEALEGQVFEQSVLLASYQELNDAIDSIGAGLHRVRDRRLRALHPSAQPSSSGPAQLDDDSDAGGEVSTPDFGGGLDQGAGTPDEQGDDEGVDVLPADGGFSPFRLGL